MYVNAKMIPVETVPGFGGGVWGRAVVVVGNSTMT
jgi:hypothetical protein